ncbi:DNA starvation/stationary phase protection protein Dps [Tropicimonas sp. IMCC34011]|uniref:DNA starvation/stationary phase protection protein Dps n=1 Tax=Tropicimonas sp. IMCC34011 TaxID=2248759 RepID=UPI000E25BB43|nr:DNA starvation/stationary phase protection protein Dps [Tropicimonas sp. IMCC34011]
MPVKGLNDNAIKTAIETLQTSLTEVIALKLALKQAHWNMKGPQFIGVHELLDDIYDRTHESSDTIAERIQILGGVAKGTLETTAEGVGMKPYPTDLVDVLDHVEALSDRFSYVGGVIREGIDTCSEAGEDDSEDLLTEVSRQIDKDMWFIEAHIKRP